MRKFHIFSNNSINSVVIAYAEEDLNCLPPHYAVVAHNLTSTDEVRENLEKNTPSEDKITVMIQAPIGPSADEALKFLTEITDMEDVFQDIVAKSLGRTAEMIRQEQDGQFPSLMVRWMKTSFFDPSPA